MMKYMEDHVYLKIPWRHCIILDTDLLLKLSTRCLQTFLGQGGYGREK